MNLTDLIVASDEADTESTEPAAPVADPAAPPPEAGARPDAASPAGATPAPAVPAPAPAGAADALFTDEALSTAKGVKAAAEHVRTQRKELNRERDNTLIKIKSKDARLKTKQTEVADREKALDQREVRLQNLWKGSPAEVLERLAEYHPTKDAIKALEEINLAAAGRRPPDDATLALKTELAELKKQLADEKAEKAKQTSSQSERQIIEQRTKQLLTVASAMPYAKLLVSDDADEAGRRLLQYKIEAYEAGRPISDQEAADKLEAHCAKIAKLYGAPGQAGSDKAEKLGTGKQLTSTLVAADGSTRKLTEDEYVEQNAPELLRDLFGMS